jgi:SAM-dependent methyltransferase
VRRLDLHKCQPARILDLGCGFGMFALAARHFGHECDGLDMDDANDPNTTMFREVFHTLNGRDRISHRIVGFEPLPVPDGSYDLTTAFQICFTNFNRPDAWGVKEWSYLLKDLKRILAPGGRVLLHFSKPEGSDLYRPPVVEEMFRELGAELDGPYACFQNLSKMDVQQVRALGT